MNGALGSREGKNASLLAGLSGGRRELLSAKLLALFERRALLYTGGDSSSIAVDTARELLASIEFTLNAYLNESGVGRERLAESDVESCFEDGLRVIERKSGECRGLWRRACVGAPVFASVSLNDTLRGIGSFWSRYDARFFAHQIPCDVDYQLCAPVSDDCAGVDYLCAYLSRLVCEQELMSRFDAARAERLLRRVVGDFRESVVNLYEPLLTNAVGLALVSGEVKALDISRAHRAEIANALAGLGDAAPDALSDAARRACELLDVTDEASADYAALAARRLWPRINLAIHRGGLEGVFPSL